MSITLDKEFGLNPRLTTCCICGGEGKELMLLGNKNYKAHCPEHGTIYGLGAGTRRCPVEKCGRMLVEHVALRPNERVPSTEPCDACKAKQAAVDALVEAGGLYMMCDRCGSRGAIQRTEENAKLCDEVRAKGAMGVRLNSCPACESGEKKEQSNG